MPSSLENLFSTNDSERNFKHKIIDIDELLNKYNITLSEDAQKIIINGKKIILNQDNDLIKNDDETKNIYGIREDNYNSIITYCNLMKYTQKSLDTILAHTFNIIYNEGGASLTKNKKEYIAKIYFLLNNIEMLFLCDTKDYKLITRILNRDNFINDVYYKKACFIAMVVFEIWSLINSEGKDEENKSNTIYQQQLIYETSHPDYKPYKNAKRIHDLIHEIKDDARDFVKSNDFDYALKHNNIEIEIPKRNLDNVIRPLEEIKQADNKPIFSFNFPDPNQKVFNGSILPNSIHGGVRRIQGGNEEKLKELKEAYEKEFMESNDNGFNQTRFLFDCLITANSEKASQCMRALSVSTAKIESYKIVATLPRATLVKLATVLGIHFDENNKIETYKGWIKRTKGDFTEYVDEEGEVNKDIKIEGDLKKETYKKLILIHYIGQVIIDKLADRNVEYDILRAQNKAKVQFNKVSGPEVSYRTKSNYTNFRSNSHSLSLSSNPIFMNMNLYSQQSPEQIDRIKSGIMAGGAPDAQLYSSNIYEKAITQALNKYKSMGFKIDPNDMKVIDDTIEGLKKVEYNILDTYSQLMNVLQFSTMKNNPSFMASLSEEEKKQVEEAWKNKDPKKILELKNKLDKELKEKQTLADNAKTILDVIFPWKKSLEETMTKNYKELGQKIDNINPKIELSKELIEKLNEEERFNFIKEWTIKYTTDANKQAFLNSIYQQNKKILIENHATQLANLANLDGTTIPKKDDFINKIKM